MFYGGDFDGISEKFFYLKQFGVIVLYLNLVFVVFSVYKYDIEDYWCVDLQFGGDVVLFWLCYNIQWVGMCMIFDGVFNYIGDFYFWFDCYQQGSGGVGYDLDFLWCDWFIFLEEGQVYNWLGYVSLLKFDYWLISLVNEIYVGEDSIVCYWLKVLWSMDGWCFDVVYMLGEGGGVWNNLQYIVGIIQVVK